MIFTQTTAQRKTMKTSSKKVNINNNKNPAINLETKKDPSKFYAYDDSCLFKN